MDKEKKPITVETDFRCWDCGAWTPEAPLAVEGYINGEAVVCCPQCGGGIKWVKVEAFMPS